MPGHCDSRGEHGVVQAHLESSVLYKFRTHVAPSVLVIDELGYLPMDQTSASWIFQVVSRRQDRGSIVLTSNRGFGDWNQIFADAVVASAIVDRLLGNATVINIKGHTYRMRSYRDDGAGNGRPKGGGEPPRESWRRGNGHLDRQELFADVGRQGGSAGGPKLAPTFWPTSDDKARIFLTAQAGAHLAWSR